MSNTAKSKTIARAAETAKPVHPAAAHQNVHGTIMAKKTQRPTLFNKLKFNPN
ncbi:MAG: hypothetical protein ACRCYO_09690 [Bacteroidia bacterium]